MHSQIHTTSETLAHQQAELNTQELAVSAQELNDDEGNGSTSSTSALEGWN